MASGLQDTYTFITPTHGRGDASQEELNIQRKYLEEHPWFHGCVSRVEAEKRIKNNGAYLVRESASQSGEFAVTTKWNGRHLHVLVRSEYQGNEGWKYRFDSHHTFPTICELINFHTLNQQPLTARSEAVLFKPMPVPKSVPPTGRKMSLDSSFKSTSPASPPHLRKPAMHRYGSEILLGPHQRTRRPSALANPLDKTSKVASLFDLTNRSNSQSRINSGLGSPPSKPQRPRQKNFGSGGGENGRRRPPDLEIKSDEEFTDDQQEEELSPEVNSMSLDRRKVSIQKPGRYLTMVDRVAIPKRNQDLWEEPVTPTTPKALSTPAERASYMDMYCNIAPVNGNRDSVTSDDWSELDAYGVPLTPRPDSCLRLGCSTPTKGGGLHRSSTLKKAESPEPEEREKQVVYKIGSGVLWRWRQQMEAGFVDFDLQSYAPHLRHHGPVERILDQVAWQRLRDRLVSGSPSPSQLAEALFLENARILLLRHRKEMWDVPGVRTGFNLLLLPCAAAYRDDLRHRYTFLTHFVIASIVTEKESMRRLKLLLIWLSVSDTLAQTFRDYFSLHAVLNAIFSKQVEYLSSTWSQLESLRPQLMTGLVAQLRGVHEAGSVARTTLNTCLPDVGYFVALLSLEEEKGDALGGLDRLMFGLVSARRWQKEETKEIWVEMLAKDRQVEDSLAELMRTETLMTLLLGPHKLDRPQTDQLHKKLDQALTMLSHQVETMS